LGTISGGLRFRPATLSSRRAGEQETGETGENHFLVERQKQDKMQFSLVSPVSQAFALSE
jgi:hypothetical protein